jgi:osmotically inducible lipoprotein OsmB
MSALPPKADIKCPGKAMRLRSSSGSLTVFAAISRRSQRERAVVEPSHFWLTQGIPLVHETGETMRQLALGIATITVVATISAIARADMVGAAAGAGSGLIVAGPVGAVAGGVIGGVFGRPFWGPPISHGACWVDNYFRRHCWHGHR